MPSKPLPAPVRRAMAELGQDLATWRRLRNLTVVQVAERADVSRGVVIKLEAGGSTTLESVLRVARALGVLDSLASSVDPYATDLGRLRSAEVLPQRVRHRSPAKPAMQNEPAKQNQPTVQDEPAKPNEPAMQDEPAKQNEP